MAIVKKYPANIIEITSHIPGLYTLEIESQGKSFRYAPGQFLHLALEKFDPSGQWPVSRCFSIQSAPGYQSIKITYSVKGEFTSKMEKQLKPGSEITVKLPYGDLFTQMHNKGKAVFIAGGTGITPFLSLFTHESFNEYINPKIYLGFRNRVYNIYDKELDYVTLRKPEIFYEDADGKLNIDYIFSSNGVNSDYFISGPSTMISYFRSYLISKGVPANHIFSDDWQ